MMICTAGHVDHGKTRLVKLLTGCETDRLKEEQERGLTIELGFAPCTLGGDLCVGIVDVPGHERFVKNMVAGVSGIDMAVLVVAADDGIMPQTVEHLQIMALLGVRHGVVALTKTDLVDDERVAEVTDDIETFLEDTFMAGAPVCPVSSETGQGFFEFYDVLVREIKGLARRRKEGVFRMPIERVFVKKGFGTVVTGIPVDGSIQMNDIVECVPNGPKGKIRGIQRFLRDASDGGYGQCLALNVPDFTKNPPVRGQVLAPPGYLRPATCFHAQIQAVQGLDQPLRNAERIKLHTGTSEQPGKLYLVDGTTLAPGASGMATIIAAEPVAVAVHDRFIVRRPSPAVTVAGGEILAITYTSTRPRKRGVHDLLEAYLAHLEGVDPSSVEGVAKRLEWALLDVFPLGAGIKELAQQTLLPLESARERVATLVEQGSVAAIQGDYFMHSQAYAGCLAKLESRIQRAVEEDQALSLTLGDLRKGLRWPGPVWNRAQEDLEAKGLLARRGDKVVLPASADRLSDRDRTLVDRILATYEETGFQSPRPEDVPGIVDGDPRDVERLMQHLYDEGRLVRLAKNVALSYTAFKKAERLVVETIQKTGRLDSADFKNIIGSTRKYALAILDFLDGRRVTVRNGNLRRLAPDYERNLLK